MVRTEDAGVRRWATVLKPAADGERMTKRIRKAS
jgi:hypothetical protein